MTAKKRWTRQRIREAIDQTLTEAEEIINETLKDVEEWLDQSTEETLHDSAAPFFIEDVLNDYEEE